MTQLGTTTELIGLGVALALALALMVGLVFIKASDVGLPKRRVRGLCWQVTAALAVAVVAMLAARVALGGPLLSGTPGHYQATPPAAGGLVYLALAGVVVIACMFWVRQALRVLQPRPPVMLPDDAAGTPD